MSETAAVTTWAHVGSSYVARFGAYTASVSYARERARKWSWAVIEAGEGEDVAVAVGVAATLEGAQRAAQAAAGAA